jgi:hypothetical protein
MRTPVGAFGLAVVSVRYGFVDTGVEAGTALRSDLSDRRLPDKADRPPAPSAA